jgi:hypothetical protein
MREKNTLIWGANLGRIWDIKRHRLSGVAALGLGLFFCLFCCHFSGASPMGTALAAPSSSSLAALRVPGPLSPRNASYRLRARLDEANHRVAGEGLLTWRNLERKPADKLVFHLYQNAFKNHASTYIYETGPQLRGDEMPERGFGAIDVSTLKINGKDVLAQAVVDDTLLTVPLEKPVGPSATVEVQFSFTVQLPRAFARSGWAESFHAVTQWFPKIGVFDCEDTCRWRAHQYHGVTEFFADYGVYDVDIDVPEDTVVGATGVLVASKREGGRRIDSYHAEDVHDFAFFTDPRFIEVKDRIADELGGVEVRLLTRPGHEPYSARHLAALRASLLEAERRLGVYPYSNATLVIPPWEGRGAGGMEYPTLFSSEPLPAPAGVRLMDDVTAHEFLHQYFYGLIGTDEVEEAWLDEGLNETFTGWVMDRMFGARCSSIDLPYLCLSSTDKAWAGYRTTTRRFPIATPGFVLGGASYGLITYAHTTVVMRTLERYLGEERMSAALRRYAERFRFRHPRKSDFTATISEGAGEDLSWFFRQALDSTRVADYQILEAKSREHTLAGGFYDCPPRHAASGGSGSGALLEPVDAEGPLDPFDRRARQELLAESEQAACQATASGSGSGPGSGGVRAPGRYELYPEKHKSSVMLYDGEVLVQRRGDFFFPVDVLLTFADGSSERVTWSLAEQQEKPEMRIKQLSFFRRKSPLVRADVDPESKLLLDENRINNGLYVEPRPRPVARLFLSLVGALQTLCDLVGV